MFSLFCYVLVGFLFALTPLWADAFGMNAALANGKALALSRASLIVLALTLTWSLAWNRVEVMSWAEGFGWAWILTWGVGLVLGLVMGGGITLTLIWAIVVGIAWSGAWSLVGAKNQLLLSFNQFYTVLILVGTAVFGLDLGGLARLILLLMRA
ncbi:hypothetical protein [Nostoc sp. LEGE 12450]|uniref:hypothetical protein n=1 Tax=Nostoc sp. LEGE 12450 TaxID=1828643 RepID=UPI0018825618|nr:hypothetical protein [Nostoc sp. LEGE 12450]MBE8988912.1 hypothetical protein [Nostoc sp. LEGE 12450]